MIKKLTLVWVLILSGVFSNDLKGQPLKTADRFKQEFLSYINATRATGCNCGAKWYPPALPLIWNTVLQKSAYGHAKDMNDRSYFSHTSKDGRTMEDRIVLSGYTVNGWKSFNIGENIAMGQESIPEVMDAWFKSEGHCQNLMNPDFKEVGIVQYNDYWVQDFGGREAWSPEMQRQIASGQVKIGAPVHTYRHE